MKTITAEKITKNKRYLSKIILIIFISDSYTTDLNVFILFPMVFAKQSWHGLPNPDNFGNPNILRQTVSHRVPANDGNKISHELTQVCEVQMEAHVDDLHFNISFTQSLLTKG